MDDFLNSLMIPSPVQKVEHPLLQKKGIELHVKREDLIHPYVSGNKWRKLKYNLLHAKEKGINKIITFGGAFSNHIHATAAACKAYNVSSIGIIRGEYDPDNPTLQFAKSCGMQLFFIDRSSYREKENSAIVKEFLTTQNDYFLVPEGGSNELANKGLKELAEEINKTKHNIILVSAGTGGTATGILKWLDPTKELWVFSSLKSDYLHLEILQKSSLEKGDQLNFISDYHLGGYGKSPEKLILFMNEFKKETTIPLDPIYNGKLIYGFMDKMNLNEINTEKSYLWIHTGGLQGIDAYNYMAKKKLKMKIS